MPKKILIIDDDPTGTTLTSFLLKTNDYEVETALDGKEGLVKADEFNPDLIVLDVQMPNMDGYTFLKELKRSRYEKGAKIPHIIMLTAKEQMESTFKMEGVAAFFVKPLETEKFLGKIKQLVKVWD